MDPQRVRPELAPGTAGEPAEAERDKLLPPITGSGMPVAHEDDRAAAHIVIKLHPRPRRITPRTPKRQIQADLGFESAHHVI